VTGFHADDVPCNLDMCMKFCLGKRHSTNLVIGHFEGASFPMGCDMMSQGCDSDRHM